MGQPFKNKTNLIAPLRYEEYIPVIDNVDRLAENGFAGT